MVERRWRHRLGPPVLALLLMAAGVPAVSAHQASVYSNLTAFNTCDGTPSTIPTDLRLLARSGYAFLGYETTSHTTTAFTTNKVLTRTPLDKGVYVHSHGDWYGAYDHAGYREDGGDCTQPVVYSTSIKAKRQVAANLVIMSTCHLAEAPPSGALSMNLAYGIERLKSNPDGSGHRGPEFYLGYVGIAWTIDMLEFEDNFWGYVKAGHALGAAFQFAKADTYWNTATRPDWFGTYNYYGKPGGWPTCDSCL